MLRRRKISIVCAAAMCAAASVSRALPPRYDHVVVVVLENINANEISGSSSAPYLNSLISQGAWMGANYGLIHTSAPNYGELFSGNANGITDGVIPPAPLSTPNLGAELRQNGYSFAGYAQSMPSVGFTGLSSGAYVRGHNPWVNWQNDAPDATSNQLPSTTNLPFTLFPTSAAGFAQLPTVSFVTPDNDHNMHNGSTLAQRLTNGDNFLKTSLDGYAQWAKTHNSLLIVTADEDDRSQNGNYNRIPGLMVGANVRAGATVAQSYTLHDVLRTIEDMYALPHAVAAANARPIAGAFLGDPAVNIKTFQNGTAGYSGTHDTQIRADAATTSYATTTPLIVDLDGGSASGNQPVQTLIRFDNLVGSAAGQIPSDATVLSAKLKLWTTNTGSTLSLHKMLGGWSDSSTWNSVGGGISANDVQAASAADFTYGPPTVGDPFFFDVSGSVQSWIEGAANNGWVLMSSAADDYQFQSSEAGTVSQRPQLEVAYALYPRFTGTGGSWNSAGNWANGTPTGAGAVARFLNRAGSVSINLDGDQTVGSLLFDSAGSYTVNPGSGGTLTLANYGNIASITLKQGQHTIAVPLSFADPTVVDIAAGGQLNASAGASVGKTMLKTGAGVLNVSSPLVLASGTRAVVNAGELRAASIIGSGSLQIQEGASVKLTGGSSTASRVSSLVLDGSKDAWTGRLDVGSSALILDYTGASPMATIANQIKTAKAGNWSGKGIGSSSAAANGEATVAVAEASSLFHLAAGQSTTFLGQPVDATSLLVRFTLMGDADLDGTVGFADLVSVAQHYGKSPGVAGWVAGDFNGDGMVDFGDLTALAQNYDSPMPAGALPAGFAADFESAMAQQSVPEPSFVFLPMLVALGMSRRARLAIAKS